MYQNNKLALIIMDGWGIGPSWGGNAITQATTPNFDYWWRTFPRSSLLASGEAVGLTPNTAGNSETGHLNIGAGHIVLQDLPYINSLIANGEFVKNPNILAAINHTKINKSVLHLVGLVGNGHVHSDIDHLYALLRMAKDNGVKNVCLDLITDGRDSSPDSALQLFETIQANLVKIGVGHISSICGRYFAMDRDNNWGRTSRAYNCWVKGEAEIAKSPREYISGAYSRGKTDEFLEPCIIIDEYGRKSLINDNDAVIFFNYRPDRARQITEAFISPNIPKFPDRKLLKNLNFLTFVCHDPLSKATRAFDPPRVVNSLAEVVSKANLTQFHIAETEKYAHVTYFINGGVEKPFEGEQQFLIPSPKVETYDMQPEMSADKVCQKLLNEIGNNFNLIIVNFANPDMVGHTGNIHATISAVEKVDECMGKLVEKLIKYNYNIVITADHGNAEEMLTAKNNTPQTEHTQNPVPFIIVTKNLELSKVKLSATGRLANIAPTILDIMGLQKPAEMTENSLILKQNAK